MEEISKALALVSQLQTALSKNVCSEVLQDEKLWERFDVQCSQNVVRFLNVLTAEEKDKFMQWGAKAIALAPLPLEEMRNIPSPEIDSSGLRKEFVKPVTAQQAPLPYIDMRNLRGKSKADLLKISQTLQKIKGGETPSGVLPPRSFSPPRLVPSNEAPPPNLSGKALVAFRREKINEKRMMSELATVPVESIPQAVSKDSVYMPSPEHFKSKRDFINARESLRKANPNKEIIATDEMHKLSLLTPSAPEVILVNPQANSSSRFSQGKKGMILNTESRTIIVPRKTPPTQISAGMAMHRVVTQQRVR